MKKELSEDQKALLRKPLPAEAITKHPTKTYLSSIKTIYVTERLNQVFGIGSWTTRTTVIDSSSVMIVVHTVLEIEEYGIRLESFGGNDNGGEKNKGFDLGDAYKGAVSDAIGKICSFLEIGIDVYKGKGDKPSAPINQRPTLTPSHNKWNEVKKRISEGVAMSEVEKVFTISEENKKLLTEK